VRIARLDIGGFGRFANVGWELEPGLTVMLGANEAGKTTLLNAVRAILFGFESARDGRTWYPALEGGRRGGRMSLLTASGERWVVERYGQRGGAGSLAVRAPNGNQGGQETLDRLMRGADRDLFNSIFAFGLGELSEFASLRGEAVRGRIYGAAAGLGGTSAIDLERRIGAEQQDLFRPGGRLQPLNRLFSRMDELHLRISELARAPQAFEQAHRERTDALAAAEARRAEARELRSTNVRLRRILDAAPIVARMIELEHELHATDASLDELPSDVITILDRQLAALAEERAKLAALDEQLAEIAVGAAGLSIDQRLLDVADEVRALTADRLAHAGGAERLREAAAAEARHAALVTQQLARVGGSDESRLVGLDDSIAADEAIRGHERALAQATDTLAAAELSHRSAADRVRDGESDGQPNGDVERDDADARAAIKALELARAAASPGRPTPLLVGGPLATGAVAAALLAICLLVGAALGQAVPGGVIGVVLAVLVIGLVVLVPRAGTSATPVVDEPALLGRAGLAAGATDEELARRADELAEARVRRSMARELAGRLEVRREEARSHEAAVDRASAELTRARQKWDTWLVDHGLPGLSSPEVARQVLAAAGIARRAAEERDAQRAIIASVADDEAELDDRATALLEAMGFDAGGSVEGRLASLVHRLDQSLADRRTAAELEARRMTLTERRGPIEVAAQDLAASLDAHLARNGCTDVEQLRGRALAAAERAAFNQRLREERAGLAGIAGGPDAIDALRAELGGRDLSAVEAELAAANPMLEAIEAEERRLVGHVGELDARIRSLESADELGTLRQELAGIEGQAEALATEWAVKAITGRLLVETRARYERERQPDVVRAATSHFERITDGRYVRIVAAPGEDGVRIESPDGEARGTGELSRGTAEQLYLSLRFGLIEEFARHAEALPVVMDDILVNFDPARAGRAASAVRDLADRHQVLYFTCQPGIASILDPDGLRTLALG